MTDPRVGFIPSEFKDNYDNYVSGKPPFSNQVKTYSDFNGNWKAYLQYMADNGDSASIDKLINYLMSEESAQTARTEMYSREDTQYQRLFEDIRKTGINPVALMFQGGTPATSAIGGNSYSGSQYSSAASLKESERHNTATEDRDFLKAFLSVITIAVSAIALLA